MWTLREVRLAHAEALADVRAVAMRPSLERVLVDTPRPASPRSTGEGAAHLEDLAGQLERGRIYDRDVAALKPAMTVLVAAFNRG